MEPVGKKHKERSRNFYSVSVRVYMFVCICLCVRLLLLSSHLQRREASIAQRIIQHLILNSIPKTQGFFSTSLVGSKWNKVKCLLSNLKADILL